jgi:hypothetical protein
VTDGGARLARDDPNQRTIFVKLLGSNKGHNFRQLFLTMPISESFVFPKFALGDVGAFAFSRDFARDQCTDAFFGTIETPLTVRAARIAREKQ